MCIKKNGSIERVAKVETSQVNNGRLGIEVSH